MEPCGGYEGEAGAELSTDHYLVVSKLQIRANLRTRRKTAPIAKRVRWEALRDEKTHEEFAKVIGEKYSHLPLQISDIETEWDLFRSGV